MTRNPIPPSRPLAGPLPHRALDGSYPFRQHRTCAEWMQPSRERVA
jgi:hypothetical protein